MLRSSLLSAMGNLHTSHLLDQKLWSVPTDVVQAPPPVKLQTEKTDAA